jgi:hypothetical protein
MYGVLEVRLVGQDEGDDVINAGVRSATSEMGWYCAAPPRCSDLAGVHRSFADVAFRCPRGAEVRCIRPDRGGRAMLDSSEVGMAKVSGMRRSTVPSTLVSSRGRSLYS